MSFDGSDWYLFEHLGFSDTKNGQINRVARYLAENCSGSIDRAEFDRVCRACDVDPDSFSQDELNEIEEKANSLY